MSPSLIEMTPPYQSSNVTSGVRKKVKHAGPEHKQAREAQQTQAAVHSQIDAEYCRKWESVDILCNKTRSRMSICYIPVAK